MHKGADAAAKALASTSSFKAPPTSTLHTSPGVKCDHRPEARRHFDRSDDKVQLVESLKKAVDAGIPVLTVDTFIGDGHYQTGSGDADFPLSYIASDNILGGEIAARALAKAIGDEGKVYVSNVNPGISTTDQQSKASKMK